MQGFMFVASPKAVVLPALVVGLVSVVAASGLPGKQLTAGSFPHFDTRTGYRIANFRAEVADVVPGGTAINIDVLEAMIATDRPVLVDVLGNDISLKEKVRDFLRGHPPERMQISGSVWLPEMGRGNLGNAECEQQKGALLTLTGGAYDRPLVFYCLSNCWVSWNAARRASSFGFSKVYWYRDGIEAWMDAGLPVAKAPHYPEPSKSVQVTVSRSELTSQRNP